MRCLGRSLCSLVHTLRILAVEVGSAADMHSTICVHVCDDVCIRYFSLTTPYSCTLPREPTASDLGADAAWIILIGSLLTAAVALLGIIGAVRRSPRCVLGKCVMSLLVPWL